MPFGIAGEREGSVPQMGQQDGAHAGVVADHLALGDRPPPLGPGPDLLLQVGERDLVAVHVEQQPLVRSVDLIEDLLDVDLAFYRLFGRRRRFGPLPHRRRRIDIGDDGLKDRSAQTRVRGPLREPDADHHLRPYESGFQPVQFRVRPERRVVLGHPVERSAEPTQPPRRRIRCRPVPRTAVRRRRRGIRPTALQRSLRARRFPACSLLPRAPATEWP